MLNAVAPYVFALRERWPRLYEFLASFARRRLGKRLGIYPRLMADEIGAVTNVLRSSQWNMAYGKGLAHERLEADFAEFVGVGHAVAVNTGGMALQMSLRALGLKPGDEVLHQVDTCSATALAVMNAGCTPLLVDTAPESFMLAENDLRASIGPATRAIIATHMWGNVEDLEAISRCKAENGVLVIEDACLALGARHEGRAVGSFGDVGVFSFGCLKPIQAGEGGMIVTNDESLAREMRAMRHWGDRTIEFGVRDVTGLAWNGRMSEIVAAVAREQLKGFPAHLKQMKEAVSSLEEGIRGISGLSVMKAAPSNGSSSSFTQVVIKLDEAALGWSKSDLMNELRAKGIHVWHANFEPINSLSFFKDEGWRAWLLRGDLERVAENMRRPYPGANQVLQCGFGLGKMNFLSAENLRHLIRQIRYLAEHPRR